MANATRFVGLDVHARESACALFDLTSGEVQTRKISGRPAATVRWLEQLERPFYAVYEAGPTGYGLARAARERGIRIDVCAPGHIRRHPTDRIKTDKRDALKLARLLAAGDLHLVRVPEPKEEQLRDLVRCREDLRVDLMRTRHRLSKFCLRRELHYPGGRNWTLAHREWLSSLRFEDRASELCFEDYLHAHDVLLSRRDRLEAELAGLIADSPWAAIVARLRCLRGIDTLSAIGLCAEVGDFERFAHPKLLASYLGLVPSEDTSGEQRRLGQITKAGSKHARRLLVEAAWHYRRPPRVSAALHRRQEGQNPAIVDLAWRAQRRLWRRWQRLEHERGKRGAIVAIAVARELSTFVWELAKA
jgi:transposase